MKILNITDAFNPLTGTTGKLRRIVTESHYDHSIYFMCYKNNYNLALAENQFYEKHNITTYYGNFGRNLVSHFKIIHKIIKQEHIDIVHFYFNYPMFLALPIKLFHPNVLTVRSWVGYIKLSTMSKFFVKLSLHKLDHSIYISKYIQSIYEKDFPILKRVHSSIIYNSPVNTVGIEPSDIQTRDLYLYLGGLNNNKNVELLIEMMNIVVNEKHRKEVVLTLVGDGNSRSSLEWLVQKYGLSSNVNFVGFSNQVAQFLNRTKIYLHPATNEGFGISVVEAMQMKCACIVSNVSALPELIENDISGLVLPYNQPQIWAEEFLNLIDSNPRIKQLGENASKRVRDVFSHVKFIMNHDNFYNLIFKK